MKDACPFRAFRETVCGSEASNFAVGRPAVNPSQESQAEPAKCRGGNVPGPQRSDAAQKSHLDGLAKYPTMAPEQHSFRSPWR